jgi:hypothetical protein
MKNRKLKNYLKLGILLFGFSFLLVNCDINNEESINLDFENSENLNLKTVSFQDAKNFFNVKIEEVKEESKLYTRKGGETPLELTPNWNSIDNNELYGIDQAQLTLADVDINRDGDYISKLFFIDRNNKMESIIFTIYQEKVEDDGRIIEAKMYFNELDGKFIDGYKIENGKITKRLVIKKETNIQKASLFLLFQSRVDVNEEWCYPGPTIEEIRVTAYLNRGGGSNISTGPTSHGIGGILGISTYYMGSPNSSNNNSGGGGASYTNINSVAGSLYTYASNERELAEGEEIKFDEDLVYYEEGVKPIHEFDNKCDGIQKIWSLSQIDKNEFAAVLTDDGAILITQELNPNGGGIAGIYSYNGKTYYQYPISQGVPSRTYLGQLQSAGRYFIPIKATIHSHTPCLNDGSDGITNRNIDDDQNFASNYPSVNHYIIGCGAIGQFNQNSNNAFNIKNGNLNTLCTNIN